MNRYLRLRTLPSEQAQVDWAHFGHLAVGRARRPLMALERARAASGEPPPVALVLPEHVAKRDAPVRTHDLRSYDRKADQQPDHPQDPPESPDE